MPRYRVRGSGDREAEFDSPDVLTAVTAFTKKYPSQKGKHMEAWEVGEDEPPFVPVPGEDQPDPHSDEDE